MQSREVCNGQSTSNKGDAFAANIIGQYESLPLVPRRKYHMTNKRKGELYKQSAKNLSLAIMPTVSLIFFFINKINVLLPSQIVVDEHSQVAHKNFAFIIYN